LYTYVKSVWTQHNQSISDYHKLSSNQPKAISSQALQDLSYRYPHFI